jgi:hypothetical protein
LTRQVTLAGVGSVLPAGSDARTRKVCLPALSLVSLRVAGQRLKVFWRSILHAKVEPASVELNLRTALRLVELLGFFLTRVLGGVVSEEATGGLIGRLRVKSSRGTPPVKPVFPTSPTASFQAYRSQVPFGSRPSSRECGARCGYWRRRTRWELVHVHVARLVSARRADATNSRSIGRKRCCCFVVDDEGGVPKVVAPANVGHHADGVRAVRCHQHHVQVARIPNAEATDGEVDVGDRAKLSAHPDRVGK